MPQIKIDHIVTFSSEDPVHTASNILSEDLSKKWKCKSPGEKNAVIVLQLEKASVITAVDIGNEHSAYVEVLVSRSGASNEDYKVLLVMSSFMTPVESRNSQNTNKVRMFTKENLSKPECNEKWDRVKVVCTQPFNKHVQYGLSFIKFHSNDTVSDNSTQMQIGNFAIRPKSPDNLSIGSLFKKHHEVKQEEKLSGASAIREATSASSILKPKLKINSPSSSKKDQTSATDRSPKRRNRNELLYSKEEEQPNEKIDKIIEKVKVDVESKKEKEAKTRKKAESVVDKGKTKETKNSDRKREKEAKDSPNSSKKRKDDVHSKHSKNKKQKIYKPTKPFNKLLEGVTLVISGIQNPDRANLRSLALSMGSKYKSDWDNTCTHLICAFPNTPKFNQVKGKGKIVKRSWIEDCHSQRKRLPWRRYALDKDDINKDESEEEIWEEVEEEPAEEMETEETNDTNNEYHEDASDTEERLVRLEEKKKRRGSDEIDSPYSVDTDKEDLDLGDQGDGDVTTVAGKLPDLFEDKYFYVDHNLDEEVYNKLFRYIIGYNGIPVVDLSDNVDFIVTTKQNSITFKEIYDNAQCVSPNWIWECHNNQKLMPVDGFLY